MPMGAKNLKESYCNQNTRRVDAIHRLRETRAMVTGYDFIFPLFQSFCFGMPIGGRDLKELFFNRRCDHVAQYVCVTWSHLQSFKLLHLINHSLTFGSVKSTNINPIFIARTQK